jgi:hypothetical protein
MSTHPPLEDRIRRLEPNWDGKLPKISLALAAAETRAAAAEGLAARRRPAQTATAVTAEGAPARAGLEEQAGRTVPLGRRAPVRVRANTIVNQVGAPTVAHLASAAALAAALPEPITQALRETFDAEALVYALLLSADAQTRTQQLRALQQFLEPALLNAVVRLFPTVQTLDRRYKLPVVARALPALRRLPAAHYDQFAHAVEALVQTDQQIDLFEYALQKLLLRHLTPHFRKVPPRVVQYYVLKPLLYDCAVLLSALAYVGHADAAQAEAAFNLGVRALGPDAPALPFLKFDRCNLAQIDTALGRFDQLSPPLKKQVLDACAQTVAADGLVQEKEVELLRAIADTLGCPLPPLLELEGEG